MSDTVDLGSIVDEWVEDTTDDAPDSQAPAGDESTASTVDETDDSETEESSGQPRDESGRFAKKGETTDAVPAAIAPEPAATPDAAPQAQPDKPFTFRSVGQEVPIDGAMLRADGSLVIPAASLPQAQQLLARGHEFQTRTQSQLQAMQREIAQYKESATQPTLNERRITAAYQHLASIVDDTESLAKMALDPEYKALVLERIHVAMERAQHAHETSSRERRTANESTEQRSAAERHAIATNTEAIVAEFPELTAEDKQQIAGFIAKIGPALVRDATQEDADQWGVRVGERVVDNTRIEEYVRQVVTLRKQAGETAKKATEAARFNKAQQPTKQTPAKPKSAPQAQPKQKVAAKNGRQEFDDVFKQWNKRSDLSFDDDDE